MREHRGDSSYLIYPIYNFIQFTIYSVYNFIQCLILSNFPLYNFFHFLFIDFEINKVFLKVIEATLVILQSFDTNQDPNTYLGYTLVCKLMLLKRLLCLYNFVRATPIFPNFCFTLAIL